MPHIFIVHCWSLLLSESALLPHALHSVQDPLYNVRVCWTPWLQVPRYLIAPFMSTQEAVDANCRLTNPAHLPFTTSDGMRIVGAVVLWSGLFPVACVMMLLYFPGMHGLVSPLCSARFSHRTLIPHRLITFISHLSHRFHPPLHTFAHLSTSSLLPSHVFSPFPSGHLRRTYQPPRPLRARPTNKTATVPCHHFHLAPEE